MTEPLQFPDSGGIERLNRATDRLAKGSTAADQASPSFGDVLLDSLDEVRRLQSEAAEGVEKLVTGETQNADEVFSAVRKADIAFSLLMEIRNKLTDAYREMKDMGV
jgi:flagellar hook-basal body complex protein FliE